MAKQQEIDVEGTLASLDPSIPECHFLRAYSGSSTHDARALLLDTFRNSGISEASRAAIRSLKLSEIPKPPYDISAILLKYIQSLDGTSDLEKEVATINRLIHAPLSAEDVEAKSVVDSAESNERKSAVGIGCISTAALMASLTCDLKAAAALPAPILLHVNMLSNKTTKGTDLNPLPEDRTMATISNAMNKYPNQWAMYCCTIRMFTEKESDIVSSLGVHSFSVVKSHRDTFRVIQSYGYTYSLSDWLRGNIQSPFNSWLDKSGIMAFWGHALTATFCGNIQVAEECFQSAFGIHFPNDIPAKSKSIVYFWEQAFNPQRAFQLGPATLLRRCSNCLKLETYPTEFQHCARCKAPCYCNVNCQKAHWKVHKLECKLP